MTKQVKRRRGTAAFSQPPVDRQIEGTIYEEVDVDPTAWMWGLPAIIALAVVDDSAGGPAACGCGFN